MILGIPLLKGELDDGRVIFYLEEEIRRKFQRMGFIIKAFVPSIEDKIFREDLEMVNGVYLPDGDYDKSIINDIKKMNIPIYGDDDFINKCKKRKVNYKKKKKIVGIISKYTFDNDISRVYLIDKVRKTIFLAGANIDFIIPIQDVDYPTTRGKDYPEFSIEDKELIETIISNIDGLLLPGGFKLTPYDRYLFEEAVKKDIPTLGICLGMQTMSCYKKEIDIVDIDSSINHKQENDDELTHSVFINKDSLLFKIIGKEKIMVNSFHKKMSTPNKYFNIVAYSEDNVIEAIEMPNKKFVLGTQWHPEISYGFDDNSKKIIDYYISLL